jgi:hypothetical protein
MSKDQANIYELSKEDFERLKNGKKYWENLPSVVKKFGESILNDIRVKELPHVMSVEGGFGSGKTHFITRFCEHLKDEGIDAIYINAWKYDYSDPLLCITKQIYQFFKQDSSFKEKALKLLAVSVKIGLKKFSPFFADEIEKVLKIFLEDSDEDAIQKFKQCLYDQIQKLTEKRLVLIIDELDRCKPDFAVRLLEIAKHFFDIEGLFIILSLNDKFLLQSLQSVYGSAVGNDNNIGERYIDKFIDSRISMYIPYEDEYAEIIRSFMSGLSGNVQSQCLNLLIDQKLTLRQNLKVCEELSEFFKSKNGIILNRNVTLFTLIACRKILAESFERTESLTFSIKEKTYDERENLFQKFLDNRQSEKASLIATKYALWEEYSSYESLRYAVREYGRYLYRDKGAGEAFAEAYLSELFDELREIFPQKS